MRLFANRAIVAPEPPMRPSGEPAPVLHRVALGDELAMRECLRRYGGLVHAIVRRYCRSSAEIDDACQDIFVALWQAARAFDPARGRESTFVALVARRRVIDRLRATREQLPAEAPAFAPPEILDRYVDARSAMEALHDCSEEQRRVITLAALVGMTQEEISRELGMPLGSVKSHYTRGIERVRRALADEEIT